MTAKSFAGFLNATILPQAREKANGTYALPATTSPELARVWLRKLGCRFGRTGQDVFFDRHDDPANVDYRNNVFLPKIQELERNSQVYLHLTPEEAQAAGVKAEEATIFQTFVWVHDPIDEDNDRLVNQEFYEIHMDTLPDTPDTEHHLLLKPVFRQGITGKKVTFFGQNE